MKYVYAMIVSVGVLIAASYSAYACRQWSCSTIGGSTNCYCVVP